MIVSRKSEILMLLHLQTRLSIARIVLKVMKKTIVADLQLLVMIVVRTVGHTLIVTIVTMAQMINTMVDKAITTTVITITIITIIITTIILIIVVVAVVAEAVIVLVTFTIVTNQITILIIVQMFHKRVLVGATLSTDTIIATAQMIFRLNGPVILTALGVLHRNCVMIQSKTVLRTNGVLLHTQ